MEEMKTFECAICGKIHTSVVERIKCETTCLKDQEEMQKRLNEDRKKKEKAADEAEINKELEKLTVQYDKVSKLIHNYYDKYGNENIYDKVANRYIPKTFFDFIF
jgi:predicted DNA-binding protein (UPF0278 family)